MTESTPTLLRLDDDGAFPNSRLPVLLWRQGVPVDDAASGADRIEQRFRDNGWDGSWQNGIFSYHHYHSTAHEVLGIGRGSVTVQLGGPSGETLDLTAGDVALLPAGTAHCNLGASDDLIVVGAYPPGQRPDILRGTADERPDADRNIAGVALPASDPVSGATGSPEPWQKG